MTEVDPPVAPPARPTRAAAVTAGVMTRPLAPPSPIARLTHGPGLLLAASAALTVMLLALAALAGTDEAGVRLMVRSTARTSLLFFLLAFTASALHRRLRAPATAWLVRNRRYLGLAFAVSHTYHLAALVVLAWRWPHPFLEQSATPTALIGGGLGFVFLYALAATSWDGAIARLGRRRWRLLHTVGSYYLWIIFAQSYLGRAVVAPGYLPFALLLLLALALRLWPQPAPRRP